MNGKVLVAVASKHGSTYEIACAIAAELDDCSIEANLVDLSEVDEVSDIREYDGVVLGSAVYAGNWLPEARKFAEEYEVELSMVPVWLFSSGPLGEGDLQPQADPAKIVTGMGEVAVRDHHVFAGKLDPAHLGLGERFIARMVKAPSGDFRDWQEVQTWAREIASALAELIPAT